MGALLNIHPSSHINIEENVYKTAFLSLFEKSKIWNQLNEERLLRQKNKELDKQRLTNKKIYIIDNKKYYKLLGMRNDYYLHENSLKDLSVSKFSIELYRYTFNGLKAQRGLIKLDKTTNKIFISDDSLRVVHFEPYELEAIKLIAA